MRLRLPSVRCLARPCAGARAGLAAWMVCIALGVGRAHASPPSLPDELAAIRRLQADSRWVASESLATVAIARRSNTASIDSLALASLMAEIIRSRTLRGARSDSVTLTLARQVLAIRVRQLGANRPEVAEAHSALAFLLGPADQVDSAAVHARQAYDIRRTAGDDTLTAESLRLMALVARSRSDYRAAARYLGEAFELRRRVQGEDHPMMGNMLAEQGFALRRSGEFDAARAALEHSLRIDERIGGMDYYFRTVPLDYLAGLENEVGNPARAIDLSEEALRVARLYRSEDDPDVLRLLRNTSGTLDNFGDYRGARALMERIVPAYARLYGSDHARTLNARVSLATARVGAGDSTRAMAELKVIETAYAARPGPPDPMLAATLLVQAELLAGGGRHAAAIALCRRAIPMVQGAAAPRWSIQAELQMRLVQSTVMLGDTSGLERERAELVRLSRLRQANSYNRPQSLRRANAVALRALGRSAEAWQEALEADRIAYQRLQANARALPDRRALQLSLQSSPTLDLLFDMAGPGDGERLILAWSALARSRGLVRAEMARRRLTADSRTDTALVAIHDRWVQRQRDYARALIEAAETPDSAAHGQLERLRDAAELAERAVARALGDREPLLAARELQLEPILARLSPGQALVGMIETDASTGSGRMTALVARGGSPIIQRVELGSCATMRERIQPWIERLAVSPGPAARAGSVAERECRRAGVHARAASWDLLSPALAGIHDLYLVPDGPLLAFPWQALPMGPSGYLIERGPTIHVLNAERELLEPNSTTSADALLAVGAPRFDGGAVAGPAAKARAPRTGSGPCAGGLPIFTPLPGTAAEVEAIARLWGPKTRLLLGASATEAAFKDSAAGHQVIHLATHGLMTRDTCLELTPGLRGVGAVEPVRPVAARDRRKPVQLTAAPAWDRAEDLPWLGRRVWLAMAGANEAAEHTADENEGLLTAEEVLTLDLGGVDWVVLSACHSGVAESWSREGALGMRRAFHLAGARTVIASLWAVEDAATSEWMQALYAARVAGAQDAGTAMARATVAVLGHRRAQHRSTHPFYWAGFDSTGE